MSPLSATFLGSTGVTRSESDHQVLDLNFEPCRQPHGRASEDERTWLLLQQQLHLLVAQVMCLVVDDDERPSPVRTVEPNLELFPDRGRCRVQVAVVNCEVTVLLLLAVEGADRCHEDEGFGYGGQFIGVEFRQCAHLRSPEQVVVPTPREQRSVGLLDDDLAARQPQDHGRDRQHRSEARYGVGHHDRLA